MNTSANIMVLLIEDDMDIAAMVSDYLSLEGIECDHAYDGDNGFRMASLTQYDVILLDVNLPFRDGMSICEGLRQEGIDTPILMLTARDTLEDKLDGFRAGADDYLVKPFALEELVMRTRVLSRRRSGEIKRFQLADLTVDFEKRLVLRSGQDVKLSPAGWVLLEVLAQNSPKVVPRARLEMALWRGEAPDSDALKVHLYKLRQRLDKPFSCDLIHTVQGQGVSLCEKEA